MQKECCFPQHSFLRRWTHWLDFLTAPLLCTYPFTQPSPSQSILFSPLMSHFLEEEKKCPKQPLVSTICPPCDPSGMPLLTVKPETGQCEKSA